MDLNDIAKTAQHQIAPMAVAVSPFLVNTCENRCPIAMVTKLNADAAMTASTRPRNLVRSRTQTIATRSHFEPYKAKETAFEAFRIISLEAMIAITHIPLLAI